jgi:hypothetical protein
MELGAELSLDSAHFHLLLKKNAIAGESYNLWQR